MIRLVQQALFVAAQEPEVHSDLLEQGWRHLCDQATAIETFVLSSRSCCLSAVKEEGSWENASGQPRYHSTSSSLFSPCASFEYRQGSLAVEYARAVPQLRRRRKAKHLAFAYYRTLDSLRERRKGWEARFEAISVSMRRAVGSRADAPDWNASGDETC